MSAFDLTVSTQLCALYWSLGRPQSLSAPHSTLRIGIAQIWQESNSFNPLATTIGDFKRFGYAQGPQVLERFGCGEEIGGFLEGLRSWPEAPQPVGILAAQAWCSGPLDGAAFNWLLQSLRTRFSAALPLDGLLISLHGALMGLEVSDVDGALLLALRRAARDIPIVVTADLHAHLTPLMVECADVIVPYHTNPHLDRRETGYRAARVLRRLLLEGARPAVSMRRIPMLASGELTQTGGPVLGELFRQVVALEKNPGVLSCGVLMCQPWLDVEGQGWSALVTTDADVQHARKLADGLASEAWSVRENLTMDFLSARETVDAGLCIDGKPVVIADGADATNSGAPGDSTHLLAELLEREIPGGALTFMVDPEAVERATEAGKGAAFRGMVGGKRDHVNSRPLAIDGIVRSLGRARFTISGHLGDSLPIDMGRAAIIKARDVTILLVEHSGPGSSPALYRSAGLEPREFKLVIVKSPAGFRAEYGSFAAGMLLSACPGCASPRLETLPWRRVTRPLWPLDPIDGDWRSVPWIDKHSSNKQPHENGGD